MRLKLSKPKHIHHLRVRHQSSSQWRLFRHSRQQDQHIADRIASGASATSLMLDQAGNLDSFGQIHKNQELEDFLEKGDDSDGFTKGFETAKNVILKDINIVKSNCLSFSDSCKDKDDLKKA